MRTAIIADWLPTFGGAEHVVAAMHRLFPTAPVFTTVARKERLCDLATADIRVSGLQIPFSIIGTHTFLLPWMPRAMERMDLRSYDVILSSSHAVGKGVIPPSNAVHICYCHTPVRYGWEMEDAYLSDFRVPKLLQSPIRKALMRLRRWDMTSAKRVDVFIANSRTTQERIRRFYGRESTVIHPPVNEQFFTGRIASSRPQDRNYFLALGRLVPYKRFDLLIEVANRLHLPLKIAGSGSDFKRLQKLAGPTVQMLGHVPESEISNLYTHARAFLFPQIEDAGVAALEAQASGTPVIALGQGGALDTVMHGITGILFPEQSVRSIENALLEWEAVAWDGAAIRRHAEQFREENFSKKLQQSIQQALCTFCRSAESPC